jgi:hypothetical protein
MDSLVEGAYNKSIMTLQQGAESSGAPLWDAGTTSEPAVEDSAKDRHESVMRYLPPVIPGPVSQESPVLTHYWRVLPVLAYMQKEKV